MIVGALLAVSLLGSCGGAISRLVTVRKGGTSGPIDFEVENKSGAVVNNLYLAKTEAIDQAPRDHLQPGSPSEGVWGADVLGDSALAEGERRPIGVPGPGRWDVRVVDRHGRLQHVTGLRLQPGGRYILELNDGGYRRP